MTADISIGLQEAFRKGGVYGAALFLSRSGVSFNHGYLLLKRHGYLYPIADIYEEVEFNHECPVCKGVNHVTLRTDPAKKVQTFTGIKCQHCVASFTFRYERE